MRSEVLHELHALEPLLPELEVTVVRRRDEEISARSDRHEGDEVAVHVALLVHLRARQRVEVHLLEREGFLLLGFGRHRPRRAGHRGVFVVVGVRRAGRRRRGSYVWLVILPRSLPSLDGHAALMGFLTSKRRPEGGIFPARTLTRGCFV